jgi:flagellar biosynthesis protein
MNQPSPPRIRQAAALSYDDTRDQSPRVVAKGKGEVAEQIIRRAVEAGVPLMESEALAKALVKIELDASVPPQLYLAVAEVLAWVYRLDAEAERQLAAARSNSSTSA